MHRSAGVCVRLIITIGSMNNKRFLYGFNKKDRSWVTDIYAWVIKRSGIPKLVHSAPLVPVLQKTQQLASWQPRTGPCSRQTQYSSGYRVLTLASRHYSKGGSALLMLRRSFLMQKRLSS